MERKVKYDYAFKVECVKLVLEKHYSCNYVSNQKGLNESNIRKWVGFYKEYGAIDKDLLSLRDSSIRFNIPDAAIIVKWKKDFANFGLVALQPKTRGRPKTMNGNKRKKRKSDKPLTREQELLLEIEALRCENELLKKLQALIQAEEKARKHKP